MSERRGPPGSRYRRKLVSWGAQTVYKSFLSNWDSLRSTLVSKEFSFSEKMTRIFVWAVVLLPILGCSPDVDPPEETSGSDVSETIAAIAVAPVEFGIGDVETSIETTFSLHSEMNFANVQLNQLFTKNKKLAKVEVVVLKPYPEEMLLTLGFRNYDNFAGHAVQVIPHIFLDDKDVPLEGFVLGGNAMAERHERTIDIFDHLDAIPSTILVRPEIELNLFLDTDKSEITLETPPTELTQSITKLGNPVRIDFLQ